MGIFPHYDSLGIFVIPFPGSTAQSLLTAVHALKWQPMGCGRWERRLPAGSWARPTHGASRLEGDFVPGRLAAGAPSAIVAVHSWVTHARPTVRGDSTCTRKRLFSRASSRAWTQLRPGGIPSSSRKTRRTRASSSRVRVRTQGLMVGLWCDRGGEEGESQAPSPLRSIQEVLASTSYGAYG